jgi:hypothetical protein
VLEQSRLNTRKRTHFYDDPLDGIGATLGRDCGNLCQQGLADGQLMHSFMIMR